MLQLHQRLGDFEIMRPLGKGGMGEVYEAQQQNPRRRVALKVLVPWLSHNEEALQRFWREAEVPAQLDHPSIVRIITTGKTDDGQAYYTMQLVRGPSLSELIKCAQSPPQPPTIPQPTAAEDTPSQAAPTSAADEPPPTSGWSTDPLPELARAYLQERYRALARIGAQAGRALAFAHQQGYLHRDIKPSNIMIDLHDQVYLVDFGLTRALEPDAAISAPGIVTGTPWYMSPEQADGKVLDPRTDIYSLGVTLYELASQGLGPFTANRLNRDAVLDQVRTGQCLPLRVVCPDIPPVLERIILKAIHFNRDKRYADAGLLAADLERFIEGSGAASKQAPRSGVRALWPASPKVRYAAAGGVSLLLLVGVLTLVWHATRPGAGPNLAEVPAPKHAQAPVQWNQKVSLLRDNHEPIWPEFVFGGGRFHALPTALELPEGVAYLALDKNPERRYFRFSTQICLLEHNIKPYGAGIFFGWDKPSTATDLVDFFELQIDQLAADGFPHGRALLGTRSIMPAQGARGRFVGEFIPLPTANAIFPLKASKGYHHLEVQANETGVTVAVDREPSRLFAIADIHKTKAGILGALGVWTHQGKTRFKEAFITALPPATNAK